MNTIAIKKLLLSISILLFSANCFLAAGVSSVDMEEKKDTKNCTLLFLLNSSEPLIPLLGNNGLCKNYMLFSTLSTIMKPTERLPQCASDSTDTKCKYYDQESNNTEESANVIPYDPKYSLYLINGSSRNNDYDYFLFKPKTTEIFYMKISRITIASTVKCFFNDVELTPHFKAYFLSSTSKNVFYCYDSNYELRGYWIVISKINYDRRIFSTQAVYNGNLGGFSGADEKCNSDSRRPDTSKTYKAILGDRNSVLKEDFENRTSYINLAGELVNSGTELSIYTTLFTLNSPIDPVATAGFAWFGYSRSYYDNCMTWTSSSSSVFGYYGHTNSTGDGWKLYGKGNCNNQLRIYCAEE